MNIAKDLYQTSLALLTDLYQVTMAYGYWKTGTTEKEAVFNLYFRKNPFGSGYTIACGLSYVIDFLKNFKFHQDELDYLGTLTGNDSQPLLEKGFLDYLAKMEFSCDIDAVPEGTAVFPAEPMLRIRGPLYQCQLVETALLNMMNFQSLVATKAARICQAAQGDDVLEFGLRRAQGIDGGLAASRAAYIGGCAGTSNVLAAKLFDIPVKGTHAHSWVMSFDDEPEAFLRYAEAMPNNCVFLVDTYNTVKGVRHAIEVGRTLREAGHKLAGIRLDSGDLAYLSTEARKLLDEAGFADTAIVASNDLDEYLVESLKSQEAAITVWGVGTKLATAYEQPALGGVYKLAALRNDAGQWDYKLKLSEQRAKITNPGIQQVRRFYVRGECIADMIYDELNPPAPEVTLIDPMDDTRRKRIGSEVDSRDLLVPIFRAGKAVYDCPPIGEVRAKVQTELSALHKSVKRFSNPHVYPVGLEEGLFRLKTDLVLKLRELK